MQRRLRWTSSFARITQPNRKKSSRRSSSSGPFSKHTTSDCGLPHAVSPDSSLVRKTTGITHRSRFSTIQFKGFRRAGFPPSLANNRSSVCRFPRSGDHNCFLPHAGDLCAGVCLRVTTTSSRKEVIPRSLPTRALALCEEGGRPSRRTHGPETPKPYGYLKACNACEFLAGHRFRKRLEEKRDPRGKQK
jgi:hypothetical protein